MASDADSSPSSTERDRGFTLVELLIVVALMGTVVSALSAVIVTALKATPSTEVRVDDARSVQGLVTWLPQDVDATPPDGFDRSPDAWPCSAGTAPDPASSHNVLALHWTERANATTEYAASYRYERKDTGWRMARYVCVNGGAAQRINLTKDLTEPWNPDDPPAWTMMCSSAVDDTYSGDCPISATTYPATETAPAPVRSLKLFVDVGDAYIITIDAAPKNPDQTLAQDPNATTNQPPEVDTPSITLTLAPDEEKTFTLSDLDVATTNYFTVNDPDGDEAAVTLSIDPTEALPTNIVSAMAPTYQYQLTLTAGPDAVPSLTPLWLIVSDEDGGWAVVQAWIKVEAPLNMAPWLDPLDLSTTRAIPLPANVGPVTIPIATVFDNIRDDASPDQLRASVTLVQPDDPTQFSVAGVAGSADIEVNFQPGIAALSGTAIEVDLEIRDFHGALLLQPLHLTIQVGSVNSNSAPQAADVSIEVTLEAGASLDIDVTDPTGHQVSDLDPGDHLTAAVSTPIPADISAIADGTTVTITAASTAAAAAVSLPIRVSDLNGGFVDVTVLITITVPPPPASNCALGSLTASPSTVARQGGGSSAHKLSTSVTVTLTYEGVCDGLRLNYDSGDSSGLGGGIGRVFSAPGSPTSIVIVGNGTGGTEQFTPGTHVLTASTSSAVTTNFVTTILTVT